MEKWQKAALGILGLGVLAVIGGIVALKILYPPERIKAMAVQKLATALGREIRLAEASIGLGGVTLAGLEISETPNFKAGTAASLDTLSVKLEWRPLLFKQEARVTDLSIDGLALNITAAIPDVPAGDTPAAKGGKTGAPSGVPPDFFLKRLSLTNASLKYEDRAAKTEALVSNLELSAADISPAQPFPLELSADFAYAGTKGGFDFKGTLDPQNGELDKAAAIIDSLRLNWDGKPYSLAGTLKPLSAPAGELSVSLPALEAGAVSIPALSGTLHAAYAQELLALDKINLKGEGASLRGALRQTKTGWRLKKLQVGLGAVAATLDGNYAETAIDIAAAAKDVDLKALHHWVPALKDGDAAGNVTIALTAKGNPASPVLAGNLSLQDASMTAAEQKLTELAGRMSFTPAAISATLGGKLNGSGFSAQAKAADYSGNRPVVELEGELKKLDLSLLPKTPAEPVPADEKSEGAKEGKPGAEIFADAKGAIRIGAISHPRFSAGPTTLSWNLKNAGSDLSKLNGTLSFAVGQGKFEKLQELGSSNKLLKVVFLPLLVIQKVAGLVKVPLFPNFDNVKFKEIVGDYAVTNGVMTINKSHLDSDAALVVMKGKADLGKEVLDLRVDAQLRGAVLRPPVAFKVTGSLGDPKVKMDAAAMLKQPEVKKAVEQGKELLKKQGEQLLKGLFGR